MATKEEMEEAYRRWTGGLPTASVSEGPIGVSNSVPMIAPPNLGMPANQLQGGADEQAYIQATRQRAAAEDTAARDAATADALAEMQTAPRMHGQTPGSETTGLGSRIGVDWEPPPEQAPYVDPFGSSGGGAGGPPPPPPPPPARKGGGGGGNLRRMEREQTAILGKSREEADAAQSDLDKITAEREATTLEAGDIAKRNAERRKAQLEWRQIDLEESGKAFQTKRDERQKELDKLTAEAKALNDEAAKIEIKDRRTTKQRVMGALAVVISGLGDAQAAGGGVRTNHADQTYSMILDAVNRDLEIQKENLASKRANAAAKFSEVGLARQAVDDVNDADLLAKNAIIDKYAGALETVEAEGAGEVATNAAKSAALQLREEQARNKNELYQRRLDKADERAFGLGVQRAQQADAAAAARARAEAAANAPKTVDDLIKEERYKALVAEREGKEAPFLGANVEITDPNAYGTWAKSKPGTAEQEKIRSAVQGYAEMDAAVNNLIRLKEEYGAEYLNEDVKRLMDQERERIVAGLNKIKDASVIQKAEYERYLEQVPSASTYGYFAIPQLEGIRDSSLGQINARLGTVGAQIRGNGSSLTRPGSGSAAAR